MLAWLIGSQSIFYVQFGGTAAPYPMCVRRTGGRSQRALQELFYFVSIYLNWGKLPFVGELTSGAIFNGLALVLECLIGSEAVNHLVGWLVGWLVDSLDGRLID